MLNYNTWIQTHDMVGQARKQHLNFICVHRSTTVISNSNLTFGGSHIMIYYYNKSQRDALFLKFS